MSLILEWLLALLMTAVSALLVSYGVASGNIWYFPGDPPFLDVALIAAAAGVLTSAVMWVVHARMAADLPATPLLRTAGKWMLVVCIALLLGCVGGIGFRLTPAWRAVRESIRDYGDEIAAAAGDRNRALTSQEFETFRERFVRQPVPVPLSGYGTVYIRMAHFHYPYVGVDFRDGRHALFNPNTMFCMGSTDLEPTD